MLEVLIYVYDIQIMDSTEDILQKTKEILEKWFKTTDIGQVRSFLDMNIITKEEGILGTKK